MLFNVIYHLCGILTFIIGAMIVMQNPKSKNHWMFFLYAVGVLGWMLSLFWGYYFADVGHELMGLVLIRLAYSFSVLTMSFMSLFFYYFPRETVTVPKPLKVFFVFFSLVLTVISATPLIHEALVFEGGVYVSDRLGPLYGLYLVDLLANLIVAFYLGIQKLIRASGIERKKLFFATFGYFIFAGTGILTNVILPIFNIFVMQREIPILTLFFVVPAFYAIQKYRFFNLSYIALNFLRQSVLLIFFFVATLLTHWLIDLGWPTLPSQVGVGISAFVGIMSYLQLRLHIPDLVSQGFREFRSIVAKLGDRVFLCDTFPKLENLLNHVFLIKLGFEGMKLFIVRDEKTNEHEIPIYVRDAFTNIVGVHCKDILIKEEIPYLRTNAHSRQTLADTFEALESDFCMPLCFDGRLSALVFLSRGENASPYSREEIKELLKVKEPLEISLMNILLKMNLQEENILMRQIIDKKTTQLRERYQKIKTLSEQQSDFISVTAHELRTPLNIAVFQTRELLNHRSDPEAMAKGLQVVDSTLGNLTSLTQKLFDAQQFDFDKVRLHRVKVDIKKWIKGIHEECLLIMQDKTVNFVLEDRLSKALKISIDPSQLRQVLHNLVGNAYKFVPAGGLIELECEEAKGGVLIRVGDSGKGIPEALRLSVFDKFRSKGAKSGIGLGLYICKKIIQLHGGKIWVGDSALGGALFSVFLKK